MYNSIQHFNEFGLKKIEKVIETFVTEKKDLADLVLDLQETLFELGETSWPKFWKIWTITSGTVPIVRRDTRLSGKIQALF